MCIAYGISLKEYFLTRKNLINKLLVFFLYTQEPIYFYIHINSGRRKLNIFGLKKKKWKPLKWFWKKKKLLINLG